MARWSNIQATMRGTRTTARLLARPPRREDQQAYLRLFLDPAVGIWLGRSPAEPLEEPAILGMLGADERHWQEHGFGPWVLEERDGGAMVGRGGLRWTELEDGWAVELPWAVCSDCWGQGFATEAAVAAVEHACALRLPEVIALIVPHNTRSRRVAEKAGLKLSGETRHAGLPHLVYRLATASVRPRPS
jgi:RimJ/RimL family protein N-acetyltransferase